MKVRISQNTQKPHSAKLIHASEETLTCMKLYCVSAGFHQREIISGKFFHLEKLKHEKNLSKIKVLKHLLRNAAQKMQIWSHLLKKSLMEKFIFYAVRGAAETE